MQLVALRRWWPLAAVVVLLGLAGLAATHSTPQLDRVTPGVALEPTFGPVDRSPPPARSQAPRSPAQQASSGVPGWVTAAVWGVLGVLALVVVGLIVRALVLDRLRRRDRPPRRPIVAVPAGAPDAARVVAAVDAGLQDLSDTDSDPRRAVIACWVRLEEAAAAAGTPRQPGDTPADLVTRLLAEHRVSAGLLARLAQVYRRARYATHSVDESMRGDAREALQQLRADLAAAVTR